MTKSNGFAFAIGYSVHWYPTRGIAKHNHYLSRKNWPGSVSALEQCTKDEANYWASPFDASFWD